MLKQIVKSYFKSSGIRLAAHAGIGLLLFIPVFSTAQVSLELISLGDKAILDSISITPLSSRTTSIYTGEPALPVCDAASLGCSALPLRSLEFKGKRKDVVSVSLEWTTTNEINSLGFDVLRSTGNPQQFQKVAFVPSIPGPFLKKKYHLTDRNDYEGISFYRLLQIDIDSNQHYSKIIPVDGYEMEQMLSIYPNPVTELVSARARALKSGKAQVQLCDISGRILYSEDILLKEGYNFLSHSVSGFSKGLYFLKIFPADEKPLIGRFVKK